MRHSIVLVLLCACGDGSHPLQPDATPDSAPDSAPADAPGTCKVETDIGSTVQEMNVATAVPAPQGGGPLVDGTYTLTALTRYTGAGGATGPTGTSISETSYLLAGASHLVRTTGLEEQYEAYTLAPSGTAIVIVQTCPSMATTTLDGYTQSNGVVTFYDSTNAASREYTLVP